MMGGCTNESWAALEYFHGALESSSATEVGGWISSLQNPNYSSTDLQPQSLVLTFAAVSPFLPIIHGTRGTFYFFRPARSP